MWLAKSGRMKMPRLGLPLCLAVLTLVVAQPSARADEAQTDEEPATEVLEATVIALDGDDLVLDVGSARAREGAVLTLYRTLEIKHPVSGKTLRDRFPNGQVRIVQAGEALSIGRLLEPPPRAPIVGDKAEAPAASVAQKPAVECDTCLAVQTAQREILEVFYRTLGKAPAERVSILKTYLEANPSSAYKSWIDYEIDYFSTALHERSALKLAERARDAAVSALVEVEPLTQVRAGLPVSLGVYVPPETEVRSVLVYLRGSKKREYERLSVALDAVGQGRAEIPGSIVKAPGFSYFVEAVLPNGNTIEVLGRANKPRRCVVRPAPDAPARTDMSRVRAVTEYVSFDGLTGRDYYWLAEADFLLRLDRKLIEGVRVGYGHYRGKGGTIEELDELGLPPRDAAFTYGYLELVLALHEMFAIMPRVEVGLGRPAEETSPESRVKGGGQLRVRIGRARGTHLILAGESTPEIGQRAFVGLTLGLLEKFPLAFEVHVTDQPVNTDELGVRAVFELGYRPTEVFALAARASYQGRTIDHAGPGLGLAATFDW